MQLEGVGQMKNPTIPSRIEPTSLRLVAYEYHKEKTQDV
jgi:hypothetical protein